MTIRDKHPYFVLDVIDNLNNLGFEQTKQLKIYLFEIKTLNLGRMVHRVAIRDDHNGQF